MSRLLSLKRAPIQTLKQGPLKMKIMLGIDPGSQLTGYGIIGFNAQDLTQIAHGTIKVQGNSLAEKCFYLFSEIQSIIREHNPTEVAVEQVFFAKNAQSALKLGQARGAMLTAIASFQKPVYEYPPTQIKKTTTGLGRAGKNQVQQMIRMLLNLKTAPQEDAADALACAVCHCHHQGILARIEQATSQGR